MNNSTRRENRILASLPRDEAEILAQDLKRVTLRSGTILAAPDEKRTTVYFPAGAVLSTVTSMEDGSAAENASVGFEGVVGVRALLDDAPTPQQLFCQMPGDALEMSAARFASHVAGLATFRKYIYRYAFAEITAVMQLMGCNRLHTAGERCATWLLFSGDRAGTDAFNMTHDALALMLGVHRPAATLEASVLQRANLISYRRGNVQLVDRAGLRAHACECYNMVHAAYENVFR